MRWIKFCGAVLAAMSMANLADAGFCGLTGACGAAKSCGCAATTQPACCKPVIVRPCGPTVHTYQRKCSDIKPPCCDSCGPGACGHTGSACGNSGNGCAAPAACGSGNGCAPACAAPAGLCGSGNSCAPGCAAPAANCVGAGAGAGSCAPACAAPAAACAPACAAPAACGNGAGNGCAPACAAPAAACAPACAAPACAPACAAPATSCAPASTCGTSSHGSLLGCGFLKGLFAKHNCASACAPTCGAPSDPSCGAPAATCVPPVETRCCNANACDIAKLIYTSQTACYARQRAAALRKLGNRYDCICNPEIMSAFIYGLNDADERVRSTAADKIGDQIRKNCCCCPEVVAALTCALGDCDRGVRRQAEQALRLCGYDIVDGNCNTCCSTGCSSSGCNSTGCAPSVAPVMEPASPAPVPPMEKTGSIRKGHLSTLLGMR